MTETEDELELDEILSVLENPIRRKILRKLSREANYPLQMSKELNVSQQAIMKHLRVLEDKDFVRSFEERSDKGGPPRKVYAPRRRYSIRIDIGPHTYNEKVYCFDEYGDGSRLSEVNMKHETGTRVVVRGKITGEMISDAVAALPAFTDPLLERTRCELENAMGIKDDSNRVSKLKEVIFTLNSKIDDLEERRRRLLALRERAYEEINYMISKMSMNYLEKEVFSLFIKDDIRDLEEISDILDVRQKMVKHILDKMDI